MLFATLDTRTRRWRLPDGRLVLLSDTVGFLRRLPHYLVASFHATLEEALRADLLLHVVDASHPDAAAHLAAVDSVLESLGRAQGARILVFNKFDRVSQPLSLQLLARGSSAEIVHVSALTGIGLDRLGRSVARRLDEGSVRVRVRLGAGGGRERSLLPELGAILAEECAEDGSASLELAVHGSALGRLHRLAGERLSVEVLGPAGLVPARDPAAAGNGRAPRSDEAV
jgi:GTP-binding protein HflX